jgi:hypothetical protein
MLYLTRCNLSLWQRESPYLCQKVATRKRVCIPRGLCQMLATNCVGPSLNSMTGQPSLAVMADLPSTGHGHAGERFPNWVASKLGRCSIEVLRRQAHVARGCRHADVFVNQAGCRINTGRGRCSSCRSPSARLLRGRAGDTCRCCSPGWLGTSRSSPPGYGFGPEASAVTGHRCAPTGSLPSCSAWS